MGRQYQRKSPSAARAGLPELSVASHLLLRIKRRGFASNAMLFVSMNFEMISVKE